MSDHNPYTPPAAVLSDLPEPPSRTSRYVLAGLILVHLLFLLSVLPMLWKLVSLGAIQPLPHLLAVLSELLLLIGGVLLVFSRKHGKIWLMLAGIGLLLAMATVWPQPISQIKWLYLAGACLGIAGSWIARRGVA